MHRAGAGNTAGKDLASLADELAKFCGVLVVDGRVLVCAELADFAALMVLAAVSIESQGWFLLYQNVK